MTELLHTAANSRYRSVVYWITTAIVAFESAMGGIWDIMQIDMVRDVVVDQLGYPPYILVILGVAKIPGAIVLVVPGLPRLKEWAYAGVLFVYLGAAISLAIQGEPAAAGPLGFATMTCLSWATRPRDRRTVATGSWTPGRTDSNDTPRSVGAIGFRATTGVVASVLFSGGIADLLGRGATVEGMLELGYPTYFVTMLGVWKISGALVILAPRLGRLKEWAYAGAFYDFAGAFASHIAAGSAAAHLRWPAAFALCVLISWALRPASRSLAAAR
ncbi:DoxX family protein [Nocardia cyriacigeorgica]|uniref:DoxX family protein n=1 Tax=Nocardia cyriacigeorgica TaxID=135487 RepID=UPI001C497E4A|nr:DoxX family protein [Nocardia cyriacigeorgica]